MPLDQDGNDIGLFYRLLGAFTIIATFALLALALMRNHTITKIEGLLVAGLIVAGAALLRPKLVDEGVKNLANWLPFFPYTKKQPPEG